MKTFRSYFLFVFYLFIYFSCWVKACLKQCNIYKRVALKKNLSYWLAGGFYAWWSFEISLETVYVNKKNQYCSKKITKTLTVQKRVLSNPWSRKLLFFMIHCFHTVSGCCCWRKKDQPLLFFYHVRFLASGMLGCK